MRRRGLMLALIGLLTAMVAGESIAPRKGALANLKSHRYTALWPEQTWREGLAAQLANDSGDPDVSWRTRANLVGLRFARQVLGWRRPDVERVNDDWTWDDGTENARLALIERGDGHGPGKPAEHWLWLQRLYRSGPSGIWSVMNVESFRLNISTISGLPGSRATAGVYLDAFTMGLPAGVRAVAGSFFRGPCGLVTDSGRVRFWRRGMRFQAAPHGTGGGDCAPERRAEKKKEPLFKPSPGAIVVARTEMSDRIHLSSLFSSTAVRRDRLLDLTAYAVEFQPREGPFPPPVPRWWSIDPRRLPICPDHRIRLGRPQFEAHPQGGLGFGVMVRSVGGACRLRESIELEVATLSGSPVSVHPKSTTLTVRGDLPRDYLVASWVLSSWCGDSRPLFTIRAAGQKVTFSTPRGQTTFAGPADPSSCSSRGTAAIYPGPAST